MTDSTKLKPCPHCGGKANGPHFSEHVGDAIAPHFWIECVDCPAGMEVWTEFEGVAVHAWNQRVV